MAWKTPWPTTAPRNSPQPEGLCLSYFLAAAHCVSLCAEAAGFKKTMAFQPRVIKQNRGSSGEGIWIIKLAEGNYCKEYGERSCEDGEVLKLMEANDNHEETHTVAEFIEFCVSGRSDKSGEWTSKGVGKYLEGGKEAGGQLVDQRFCPRIVEGAVGGHVACKDTAALGLVQVRPGKAC